MTTKKINDLAMLKALLFPVSLVPVVLCIALISALESIVNETDHAVHTWLRWWRE